MFLVVAVGCDLLPGGGAPELELEDRSVQLPPGTAIHDVSLDTAPGGGDRFQPEAVRARSGDVVRFTAAGLGTHAIGFIDGALSAGQRGFLERTRQEVSPPLLDSAVWVVSLEGAPAGDYPFHCVTHGLRGMVSVAAGRDR